MSLATFFSLSPLEPYFNSYDSANPNAPYTTALCQSFGATVLQSGLWTLTSQHLSDRVITGYNAEPLTNQDLWSPHPFKTCMSRTYFWGYNVSTENQYLLIFELEQIHLHIETHAQIFVNNDLVDTVQVSGIEQHAILLNCPGHGILTQVWVRLASPAWTAAMAFRGVDCHLL